MLRPRLIALLLALATLAVYLPVAHFDFLTYDDNEYVTDNPVIQQGLSLASLKWAFTTGWASNWHPVTWISHLTDYALFGFNPGAHHFVNVVFHGANAALLFLLWLRLTGKIWPSAFVAALFAWHPLHVESVAWVAERKDVLSTFFWLLTLLCYVRFVEQSRGRNQNSKPFFVLSLLFFLLGLMSKPMLVTLPFILLLLDLWPLCRSSSAAFRWSLAMEKIPFFVLAAASCIVTFLVQWNGHSVATLVQIPLGFRLENATVSVMRYLQKMFWPSPLAVIYPLSPIPSGTLVLAAIVLAVVSILVWRVRHMNPCWLIGWLWFLVTLVPVIGVVQVGDAAMADRYTYIPSIGIFSAVTFGLHSVAEKSNRFKKILAGAAILSLVVSIVWTEWQLHYWRDTETLFRHSLLVTRDNAKARFDLAIALDQQERFPEALTEYRETIRLDPTHYAVHYDIGRILGLLGRHVEALAEFREAVRYEPQNALWHCAVGGELAALGQDDNALKEFAEAARLQPDFARPHIETAKIFFQRSDDREAVDALHAALRAEPDRFQTLATIARFLATNEDADARDGRLALTLALRADALSGHEQPLVLDTLGMAYAATGDFASAQASAQNALTLAEDDHLKDIPAIRQRLELYKNGQPWRESFRSTNAPVKN